MSQLRRAAGLLLGFATKICVAFVPVTVGEVSHTPGPILCAPIAVAASGASRITSPHVERPSRRGGRPLTMAREGKRGKGKAGRIELIESFTAAEKRDELSRGDDEGEEEGEESKATPTFSVDKLRAETKTPFRTFRIFIYGACGTSALIGGVTSLTQLAATLSEQPGALELQKVLINLLVDFGVMAAAAFCYNFETSQQEGLEKMEAAKREKRRKLEATKISEDVNAMRVEQLRALIVKVPGSGTGSGLQGAKEAPVGVLMDEAKQSICIVAGGKAYIRDCILAAMLAKNQIFPNLNMLVVPIEMEEAGGGEGPKVAAKGFGTKSLSYEQEGYVAAPVNEDGWRALMEEEFDAAERQGVVAKSTGKDGIVLLVSKKGKVLRRGVGVPMWDVIRDDVDPPPDRKDGK